MATTPTLQSLYETVKGQSDDWSTQSMETKISVLHGFILASLPNQLRPSKADLETFLGKHEPPAVPKVSSSNTALISEVLAKRAFKHEFVDNGGAEAFLHHLRTQRTEYGHSPLSYFPFFAIMQSSGYGKSKLVDTLCKKESSFKYLSFASKGAIPAANVVLNGVSFETRDDVGNAFCRLFKTVISSTSGGNDDMFYLRQATDEKAENPTMDKDEPMASMPEGEITFIIDEVAELLKWQSEDGVNFFRAFRQATRSFVQKSNANAFFVVVSTFSDVSAITPPQTIDASAKFFNNPTEAPQPLESFFLHHAIGLSNDCDSVLKQSVPDAMQFKNLWTQGRMMWASHLQELPATSDGEGELLTFATAKLLKSSAPLPNELTVDQKLALLACRACISISPLSRVSASLAGSHMATIVSVSKDRYEVLVSYPSEPILAMASQAYQIKHSTKGIKQALLSQLKESIMSGVVGKGHRGELIVRLLNLMAMDKCVGSSVNYLQNFQQVTLREFLSSFDRKGASVSNLLLGKEEYIQDSVMAKLTRQGLQQENILSVCPTFSSLVLEGTVNFNHFVYIAKKTKLTPTMLRWAYYRGAGIVVEEGRRGVDWILPVYLGTEDGFTCLVGQDKNRVADLIHKLEDSANDETHQKVTTNYFLNKEERTAFEAENWNMNWPAVLFAVGCNDVAVAFANQIPKTRGKQNDEPQFPCLILTGMGYKSLAGDGLVHLESLREFEAPSPDVYKTFVPITFDGVDNPDADSDEMECESTSD